MKNSSLLSKTHKKWLLENCNLPTHSISNEILTENNSWLDGSFDKWFYYIMDIFILEADIKLLSVNQAFIVLRNGARCRSKEYLIFANSIGRLLNLKRTEFLAFNNHFDPFKHEIHAELIQYTDDLYTKDGRISQKSGDLGNMEKCITDCVLVNKIDDSAITSWSLKKIYSPLKGFKISFKIIDRV